MTESRNVYVKRFVIIILLLLITVSANTESRSLKPASTVAIESRKVSQLVEALHQLAAYKAAEASDRQPSRVSPGGPDPHHHFQKN
ncbi:hypothetical protein L484_006151 [Morus notabilis]|uniref:Uncharacterized protein n=1 Tax=Morus notabilis TaxID=981085 RepID=W9RZJ3_9ROSA|nr:hypothetical protein L484_006151 [Morus notabilis]